MKSEQQSNNNNKLTIFKPPGYIYKLRKCQLKNNQKLQYQTLHNHEYSLRKYNRRINITNQSQLMLYQWRKQTNSPVVNVVYLQLVNKTISSNSSQNGFIQVNVYTEHIQKYLADMINLTLNEAIYVLKESLLAYQQLYLKFSAVSINKFYLGLNDQGKLKVWINNNLSLNSNPDRSQQNQSSLNDIFIVQAAIVNKIVHMIGLLVNTTSKHFFFGLEKELSFKRFSFNNCLEYINSFVSNTKNIEIPSNLSYMLPKKNQFILDRSAVKFTGNNKQKINHGRKQTYFSNLANTNSFKHFGSFVRICHRQNTQNQVSKSKEKSTNNTKNQLRFKRYSQQGPKALVSNTLSSNTRDQLIKTQKNGEANKQCKVSLHMIIEKNRRSSVQSNEILMSRKSNVSLQRQRPSICILPQFICKSARGDEVKEQSKQVQMIEKQNKEIKQAQKSQKSYSIKSSRSKDYRSLVNSKINSSNLRKFAVFSREELMFRTHKPTRTNNQQKDNNYIQHRRSDQISNMRSRSVSANIKFGSYQFMQKIAKIQPRQTINTSKIQDVKSDHRKSTQKSRIEGDKTSTNSISNEGTKRRSFLNKTNYDSNADDNDKNTSICRMDFSSMSIQNRITNKNFDSQVMNPRKQEMKRSLMSFKYGFEQILQNPSCKQVQQENETKSYNGSSLRNTQNISDQIQIIRNVKKNQQTSSNNYSFGNNSNRLTQRRLLKDSIEQKWDMIRQKNEQVLQKNQWKKTINNLGQLQNIAVNESIVDVSNDMVIQKDYYADVRLQKLQKLGRNMCYSIIKKNDDNMCSSMKKSDIK